MEVTYTQEATLSVGYEVGLANIGGSVEATASYGQSNSTSQETSFAWSEEQREENRAGLALAKAKAIEEGTILKDGQLQVAVNIVNDGDLAYTVKSLLISAVMSAPRGQTLLVPIGTLSFDTTFVAFPELSLGPGQSQGPLLFEKPDLPLATIEELLMDSSLLDLRVAAYEVTDSNGRSFTHNQTQIHARTATIIVDYDGLGVPFSSERYQVATNVDATRLRVDAFKALTETLRIPIELDDAGDLVGVRGVQADEALNAVWAVVHNTTDGILSYVTQPTAESGTPFNDIELKSGDVLHLVYIEDRDFDGLGSRMEVTIGTDPDLADTDGDSLLDGEEVWVYNTDPLSPDTDGDGLSDGLESHYGTSPLLKDTDGNGVWDPDEFFVDMDGSRQMELVNAAGQVWTLGLPGTALGPQMYGADKTYSRVHVGYDHYFRKGSDGLLYGIGNDKKGALGNLILDRSLEPTPVQTNVTFSKLDAGRDYTLAIATDGTLWAWGYALWGQLGIAASALCSPTEFPCVQTPTPVGSATWISVAAGDGFSAGVQTDGTLWTWGEGNGSLADPEIPGPQKVGEDTDWLEVAAVGREIGLALKSDGTLWSWGSQDGAFAPALGLGLEPTGDDLVRVAMPTQIGSDSDWASVSGGETHVLGLKSDGSMWGWGASSYGELATFESSWFTVPVQIGSDTDWRKVVAGYSLSLALKADHKIYGFGYDLFYRLNRETEKDVCIHNGCSAQILPIEIRRGE